ncbi:MAG: hypothetical protein RJA70_2452 [Pseudomonadota bacterium]|jgi:hypothetical protein
MFLLRVLLLVIHIAAAAVIFAAPLGSVGSLRRALAGGDAAVMRSAAKDAAVRAGLASAGSLVTLATGLALIFLMGGFGVVRPQIHAALGLLLLAIGFSLGFVKPAGRRLGLAALAEPPDKLGFGRELTKLRVGAGVLHLLWTTVLVLMVYR